MCSAVTHLSFLLLSWPVLHVQHILLYCWPCVILSMTNKPKTETENSVQHDKEEVGKELLLLAERQQTEKL